MAVTVIDKDISCPYNEVHYQFDGRYMLVCAPRPTTGPYIIHRKARTKA